MNAQLGRWISADPLAVHAPGQADLNLYAYVSGSVLKNVDPLGLAEVEAETKLKDLAEARKYAILSGDAYDNGKVVNNASTGQHEASDKELAILGIKRSDLRNDKIGFAAKVYIGDKTNEVTLAFRGTDNPFPVGPDWGPTNVKNAYGGYPDQYRAAAALARQIVKGAGSREVTFTGHSLGGGLAQWASGVTGRKAITFDAADFNRPWLSQKRADASQYDPDKIVNYEVAFDPVEMVSGAAGSRQYILNVRPGSASGVPLSTRRHGIETMVDTINFHIEQWANQYSKIVAPAPPGKVGRLSN